MTIEIQKADTDARMRIIKWLVVAALAGLVLLILAEPLAGQISDWALSDPERAAQRIGAFLVVLCLTSIAPLALLSSYLVRYAAAVTVANRYPLPDRPVTRDTRVVRGSKALVRARTLRILAAVIAVVAIVMVYFYWRAWSLLQAIHAASPPVA